MLESRLSLRVATDRMAAFVTIRAGEQAEQPSVIEVLAGLRAALDGAGVRSGLDEAALDQLAHALVDPAFERAEALVASGTPPQHGRDGWVEAAFEQGALPGSMGADGHMNFFERNLLKTVSVEQVVVTLHPPEQGRAGHSVQGQTLPARSGAAVKLQLGPGVGSDAQGVVRAQRDGVVLYKPNESLDVVDRHVHQGSVDLRTGHLEMQGSLSVKGDVERLLQVRASGDIEVLGSVSGGSLRAGGSVKVSGSVRGGDDARVVASGDATVKSCEAAQITARGLLRVQEAINSTLSGNGVVVTGRLRGGSATGEAFVDVKEAGTSSGVATLLRAGEPLELPDLEQVQRAVVMQKLRRMAERGGVRDAFGSRGEARGKGSKLGRVSAALSQEELTELAERAERRAELQRRAYLALGLGHAGVELRIGPAHLTLQRDVQAVRYVWDPETGQLRAEGTIA